MSVVGKKSGYTIKFCDQAKVDPTTWIKNYIQNICLFICRMCILSKEIFSRSAASHQMVRDTAFLCYDSTNNSSLFDLNPNRPHFPMPVAWENENITLSMNLCMTWEKTFSGQFLRSIN